MARTTGPPDCCAGFHPAILCPVCGKGAVLVQYDDVTGVCTGICWHEHL